MPVAATATVVSRSDRTLVCFECGRRAAGERDRARCDCGQPLWYRPQPAPVALEDRPADMWAYGSVLPTGPPAGVGGTAGGTPLVRAPALDAAAGCRVHLKLEAANPTGSFKDRGSAVGVAAAAAADRPVLTVSHGNMARSVAATAAAAGVDCAVLVPADIPAGRLAPIARFDPTLLRVDGDYGRLYHDALELGTPLVLNSDVPLRVAGQRTLAFEVAAERPDADGVVLPVSSGGNASAVWKGYRELRAAGRIEEVPPLYLVQSAACDPIAEAYRTGAAGVDRAGDPGETVAYSIANPDPPSGTRALRAARRTGGAVVSVADDAVVRARERLATRAGVTAEAAAATTVAGLRRLVGAGTVAADDDVVAVVTGTGAYEAASEPPAPPTVARDEVGRAVRDRLG